MNKFAFLIAMWGLFKDMNPLEMGPPYTPVELYIPVFLFSTDTDLNKCYQYYII